MNARSIARFFSTALSAAFYAALAPNSLALSVVNPPAGSTTIASGNDYATQVIGDAWDMNNAQDIDTDESVSLNSQTFSGGIFSAVDSGAATSCGAAFYPLFMGYGTQTVTTARGPRFPIDTSVYRYFTIKLKATAGTQAKTDRIIFFENGDSTSNATYGSSTFGSVTPNNWVIQTWDFYNDTFGPAQGYQLWTSLPQVQGIEVAICNAGSPNLQVDWIRLTSPPTAGQMYTVTWSDTTSSTYTITAIDADGAQYPFTSGATGTSYGADISRLAPGDYHIQVSRSGATAMSAGVLHVNTPPQIQITAPTQRGEQALSYAVQEQGGQWGPMSAADFESVVDFKNVSYTNPAGSFYGRPTNNDPEFIMNTAGHPVDSSYYRSACFTLEVFGPRSVGAGSVARLFWGPSSASVSTTTDIVLSSGLTEYCLPDLADTTAVPLVAGSPQPWAGNLSFFRMDPDELTPPNGCTTPQTCFDVQLNSISLAPFAEADPAYTVQWSIADADYSGSGGSVELYLDPDKTYGNGNEILIASLPYTLGTNQYNFIDIASAPDGTYNVVVLANDGINSVAEYAGGPIVIRSDVIFRDGFQGP